MRFMFHQFLFHKMPFHHLQSLQVFHAGFHNAVALVVAHTINIMGAGIQKRDGRDVARNAFAKAQRIEITRHSRFCRATPKSAAGSNAHSTHRGCRPWGWLQTAAASPRRCRAAATSGCRWRITLDLSLLRFAHAQRPWLLMCRRQRPKIATL